MGVDGQLGLERLSCVCLVSTNMNRGLREKPATAVQRCGRSLLRLPRDSSGNMINRDMYPFKAWTDLRWSHVDPFSFAAILFVFQHNAGDI